MSDLHDFISTGNNDIEGFRKLLRGGENPNAQDRTGQTPLHIAVRKCESNPQDINEIVLVVRELISFGANVNLGNNIGSTPLHLAAMCRIYDIIDMLLQANAEIDKKDVSGWAALHYATTECSFCRVDGMFNYQPELRVVKLLLRYHPDVDIQNWNNETPLMLAARNKNLHIVRELLKKNASVNLQDSEGNSAMHYALDLQEVDVDVMLELARHGCSFNTTNDYGVTPRDCYFDRLLLNHSHVEVEKAKHVIKLLMLDGYHFNGFEENCLRLISRKNNSSKLLQFLYLCYNEIIKMHWDKFAPNHCVYNLALKGAFCRDFENDKHIAFEVFDEVIEKLIRGRYPGYCDVIVSGICSPYMNKKFAEMCCDKQTGIAFLNFHVLYFVSYYLSHFDMLNMMIACTRAEKRSWNLPRFTSFATCSVS